jgi:hypothetical protein
MILSICIRFAIAQWLICLVFIMFISDDSGYYYAKTFFAR